MSKKPWAPGKDALKRITDEYQRKHNIRALGGKVPTGKVLHKGVPTYSRDEIYCDRYLVVSDEVWLMIDEHNDVIEAVEADYFGRIHWEHQCPSLI